MSLSANIISGILVGLTARKVGEDVFGNRYYERREKRPGLGGNFFRKRENAAATNHPAMSPTATGGTASGGNRGRARRFVLYNGTPEASKIPPDWHGWLHYTEESPPPGREYPKRTWQKAHLPNLTGTIHAVRPQSRSAGIRPAATGDYEAWKPE